MTTSLTQGAGLSVVEYLEKANILTQENLSAFFSHGNQIILLNALYYLNRFNNQENFSAVVSHPYLRQLFSLMQLLARTNLFTSDNIATILNPAPGIICMINTMQWERFRIRRFTANWTYILELTERADYENALRRFNNQLLDIAEPQDYPRHDRGINHRQSTHTASVHQSVSQSAIQLLNRYGRLLDDVVLQTIITKINTLTATPINEAAQRCLKRLLLAENGYTDTVSKVSTLQLLQLSWLAIHDEALRQGTLNDALQEFCHGLYESQRGYNLSEEGIDQGGADDPICTAGTFNKFVEKLAGIHPDVMIIHITPQLAALKLSAIIKEEVIRYISKNTNPSTTTGFLMMTEQLIKIQQNGLSAIWTILNDTVSRRLFNEFHSLYSGIDDPRFTELVDAGQDLDLGELPSYHKELSESEGYYRFCGNVLKPLFFAPQHQIPAYEDSPQGAKKKKHLMF